MTDFLYTHGLDIVTTMLGLAYIILEYKASIWLWLVGIVMPVLDIVLYWQHGLYGDAGIAVYYTLAAVYGYIAWQWAGRKTTRTEPLPISSMPMRHYLPATAFFFTAWGVTYWVLVTYTNSTVPVLDSFTNALSFVGLWALARKYIEQWCFWIAVDAICLYLYTVKGIPFKAGLYGLYTIIAIAGYFKWKSLMTSRQ